MFLWPLGKRKLMTKNKKNSDDTKCWKVNYSVSSLQNYTYTYNKYIPEGFTPEK